MTLKEKFGKLFLKGRDTTDFEQIADEYAIGFAKWSRENHIKYTVLGNVDSYKELLEIYKKTL